MKKFLVVLLALTMIFAFSASALADTDPWTVTGGASQYCTYGAAGTMNVSVSYSNPAGTENTMYGLYVGSNAQPTYTVTVAAGQTAVALSGSVTVATGITGTPATTNLKVYEITGTTGNYVKGTQLGDTKTVTITRATEAKFDSFTTTASGATFASPYTSLVLPASTTANFNITAVADADLTVYSGLSSNPTTENATLSGITVPAIGGSKTVYFIVENEAGETATKTVTITRATEAKFDSFSTTASNATFASPYTSLVLPASATANFNIIAVADADLTVYSGLSSNPTDENATLSGITVPAIGGTKTVYFKAVNEAGEIATKNIVITRPADAKLANLTVIGKYSVVDENTDSSYDYIDFSATDFEYSETTYGATTVTVNATTNLGYTSELYVGGTTSGYKVTNNTVTLNEGVTKIYVKVYETADPTNTNTYEITLTMAMAANLDDIVIEDEDGDDVQLWTASGSSKTTFRYNTYDYTIYPDDEWDSIFVEPVFGDSDEEDFYDLDVAFYKTTYVDENDDVYEITMRDKDTDLIITVSQTGYQDRVYTFSVVSGSGVLEDLVVYEDDSTKSSNEMTLYPAFDADVTSYSVFLPYDSDVDGVTVYAEVGDEDDTLTIDGNSKSSNDTDMDEYIDDIDDGDSKEITIVAGNRTYTVTVYRGAKSGDDDTDLNTLEAYISSTIKDANKVTLTQSGKIYTGAVATTQEYVYIYTKPSDSNAFVLVNGEKVSSGSAKTKVELKTGLNKITVTVIGEDCETVTEYTVNITRGIVEGALKSLVLYDGYNNRLNFSPTFNKDTDYYCTSVSYNNSTIKFYPTANATTSTIKINGTTVSSAAMSMGFNLSVGQNTFDIAVTAADNTVSHYYVNVLRHASSASIQVSSQKLSINGGTATSIAAYNIDGYNYLKLRDVAKLLSGTAKQFSVGYNDVSRLVTMTTGRSYVAVGGELVIPGSYKAAKISSQTLQLDGSYVYPAAYNIDGNNYFLLRDIGVLLDCSISYNSSTRVITINTSSVYAN